MELFSLFGLGILLGAQHALEPDHIAAVMTLIDKEKGIGRSSALGVSWGLGHSASLGLVSVIILVFKISLPQNFSEIFESLVGLLLVILGLRVIFRGRVKHLHNHVHPHDDGTSHTHVHTHRHALKDRRHRHYHWRSFAIGGMHGLAGSGALVVLAAGSGSSLISGLSFVVAVGFGLMLGMGVITTVIGYSLQLVGKVEFLYRTLTLATAFVSIGLGVFFLYRLWLV